MELYSIGKFAKLIGVSTETLRRMHKTQELVPCHISDGGTRYYSSQQLASFFKEPNGTKSVVGYCRVSTNSQKDDLCTQIENVKAYMYANGYQFEIISDIGSGIDYKKPGLCKLINLINSHSISKVVILYKDRLVRFGFDLIEYLCQINNVELEVIDNSGLVREQELTDDLIQIITVFANRLYGQQSKKTKRLIDEVKNNDIKSED